MSRRRRWTDPHPAVTQEQRPLHGPQLRVCANARCRKPYAPSEKKNGVSPTQGYCPECALAIRKKQGWKLDMALYVECQKIALREPLFRAEGGRPKLGKRGKPLKKGRPRSGTARAYEEKQLEALAKKPIRAPYVPSARGEGHKVGGPSNRGGD